MTAVRRQRVKSALRSYRQEKPQDAFQMADYLDKCAHSGRKPGHGQTSKLRLGDTRIEARANDRGIRYFINDTLVGRMDVCNVIRAHLEKPSDTTPARALSRSERSHGVASGCLPPSPSSFSWE